MRCGITGSCQSAATSETGRVSRDSCIGSAMTSVQTINLHLSTYDARDSHRNAAT